MYQKKFTRPPLSSCKRKGPHAHPPQIKKKPTTTNKTHKKKKNKKTQMF